MPRILSFNSSTDPEKESEKENLLKKLWESFSSFDKFTKFFILIIVVFMFVTPVITKQYFDTRQRADRKSDFLCETIVSESNITKPDLKKIESDSIALKNRNKQIVEKIERQDLYSSREELKQIVSNRKELLVKTMRQYPNIAWSEILPKDKRKILDETSKNCVETETTAEGTLDVIHADFFEDNSSIEIYTLITSKKDLVNLYPANLKSILRSGMKIKIEKGYKLDNNLLFDASTTNNLSINEVQQSSLPSVENQQENTLQIEKTLVVPVYYVAKPELSKEKINDYVFNQVKNYYNENSYGKLIIQGETLEWYSLGNSFTCGLYYGSHDYLLNEIIDKIKVVVDLKQYNNGNLVVIGQWKGCSWQGLYSRKIFDTADGLITLDVSLVASYGLIDRDNYIAHPNTIAHEMGHGFGFGHANGFYCGSVSLDYNWVNCQTREYMDFYDIMGSSRMGFLNAAHKDFAGYFKPSHVLDVTENGTYSIEPIETLNDGVKTLRIKRYKG